MRWQVEYAVCTKGHVQYGGGDPRCASQCHICHNRSVRRGCGSASALTAAAAACTTAASSSISISIRSSSTCTCWGMCTELSSRGSPNDVEHRSDSISFARDSGFKRSITESLRRGEVRQVDTSHPKQHESDACISGDGKVEQKTEQTSVSGPTSHKRVNKQV